MTGAHAFLLNPKSGNPLSPEPPLTRHSTRVEKLPTKRRKRETMTISFYDLAGADDNLRFSPYCWRVKMALRHKGLEARAIPWRFTEKEQIAFSGQGLVPVLVDGEKTVSDSWEIARYLEEAYPDHPSLFGGSACETQLVFLKSWCELTLHPLLLRLTILDLFACLHDKDKAYFRQSRESRFGKALEQIQVPTEQGILVLREALAPLRATLQRQPYVTGSTPRFADYMVFAHFQFAQAVSPLRLIEPDDPVYAWRERLLATFGGFDASAPSTAL